jgi:hypothetical protein
MKAAQSTFACRQRLVVLDKAAANTEIAISLYKKSLAEPAAGIGMALWRDRQRQR